MSGKVFVDVSFWKEKSTAWPVLFLKSTSLHPFFILPVTESIFGMSGCFPVSQGQEMKNLTASSVRKATATRGCQCSFSNEYPIN